MTGVELIIGGQFASSVIRKVVNFGSSYLGDNYDLHTETGKMLKNLEIQLPQIQCVMEAAEKQQITCRGLDTWLDQLKDAAYEAEDVLDDFEAKRIRKSIKGKGKVSEIASSSVKMVKTLIFSDKDLKRLGSVVDKLDKVCMSMGNFIKTLELIHSYNGKEHLGNLGRETSSNLAPDVAIFGRDKEIELILDMIFNVLDRSFYHQDIDDCNLQQGEEGSNSFWGFPTILGTVQSLFTRSRAVTARSTSSHIMDNEITPRSSSTTIRDRYATAEQSTLTGPAITTIPTLARSTSGSSSSTASAITTSDIRFRFRLLTITNIVKPQSINNRKLAVIPIVGVGGVGKTIVAKMIYNDEKVKEHFALRAWVSVSKSCDAKKIMQEMLSSFKGGVIDRSMNLENVENKLKEIITDRRFILVLDDMRDKTQLKWSDLRSVLCYGEVGSVVVITTQSICIANTTGTLPEITLDVLQPESFQELFQYYAFGGFILGELNDQPPSLRSKQEELKLIGKKIAGKLHGLPLAGKVIGTLLSYKLEREFWDDVCGSDWWNIKDARENILSSIGVGYNYLDPELKQCFVFCSIFPKHYVFERERLVQMWIAQGFIQPSKEETGRLDKGETRLEDIGRKWFGELVERSFFQPTLSDGKYIMHDLVRDLAKAVSSNEFCFIKSHDNHLPSLARHVGIDCDNSEVEWKSNDSTRLRTMILFGNWTNCCAKSISNIFAKYKGLRVLDLSYITLKTDEPINAACRLWHLRFVDLSFTGIKSIPDEFCALYHLQVLDLRGCFLRILPEGMNQLINLRHLYACSNVISRISSIGKLTKLQELEVFCIRNLKEHRIIELMNMNEISGHLLLSNIHYVSSKEEAAISQLDKKKYLKSLDLRYDEYYPLSKQTTKVTMEVLDALKPGRSLEILKIGNCILKSLPSWVFSPHHGFYNLKVVHVYNFLLSSLPPFGELPSLEVLSFDKIPSIKKVGSEFYGNSDVVFPSLKELKFSRMSSWIDWSDADAGKTVFPHLKKLCIEDCRVLKELPVEYSFTSSVVELVLMWTGLCNIETVLQRMPSLAHLSIKFWNLNSYSISCTPLNSLEVMYLYRIKTLRFVGGLKSLVNLRKLVIEDFDEIQSCEVEQDNNEISQEKNEEQCLQFLKYLHLRHSAVSQNLPIVGRLSALRTLLIDYSPATEYTIEEESWFNQLTSLEKLEFRGCRKLRFLPSQLHLLTSLKKLHINRCPQMLSLPENGLPQSLVELYIDYCPDLIDRCQPNKGNDWHKISHIPVVQFKKERREQYM